MTPWIFDFKHVWTPLCGATPSQQPEKILSFFINIVPGMNESWSCNELLFTFFCSSWFMSPGPVVNLGLKLFPARRFLIWVWYPSHQSFWLLHFQWQTAVVKEKIINGGHFSWHITCTMGPKTLRIRIRICNFMHLWLSRNILEETFHEIAISY